jgi:hypothetical protein
VIAVTGVARPVKDSPVIDPAIVKCLTKNWYHKGLVLKV